jgi:hypothetical protein
MNRGCNNTGSTNNATIMKKILIVLFIVQINYIENEISQNEAFNSNLPKPNSIFLITANKRIIRTFIFNVGIRFHDIERV